MSNKYYDRIAVEKVKNNITRAIFGGLAAATIIAGASGAAFADANNYCGTNSANGSANGCAAAKSAGAQCGSGAASGAFGAFGPGTNFAGGADGQQTGLNNSGVCGDRQGNL